MNSGELLQRLAAIEEEGRFAQEDSNHEVSSIHNSESVLGLLKDAANNGCVESAYKVGVCFENGDGVEVDEDLAFRWFYWAAENEYNKAQYKLGLCYNYGKHVEVSHSDARFWYKMAYQNGYKAAAGRLAILYHDLAQTMHPSHPGNNQEPFDWCIDECIRYLGGNVSYRGYLDSDHNLVASNVPDYEDLKFRIQDLSGEFANDEYGNFYDAVDDSLLVHDSSAVLTDVDSHILDNSSELGNEGFFNPNNLREVGNFSPQDLERSMAGFQIGEGDEGQYRELDEWSDDGSTLDLSPDLRPSTSLAVHPGDVIKIGDTAFLII